MCQFTVSILRGTSSKGGRGQASTNVFHSLARPGQIRGVLLSHGSDRGLEELLLGRHLCDWEDFRVELFELRLDGLDVLGRSGRRHHQSRLDRLEIGAVKLGTYHLDGMLDQTSARLADALHAGVQLLLLQLLAELLQAGEQAIIALEEVVDGSLEAASSSLGAAGLLPRLLLLERGDPVSDSLRQALDGRSKGTPLGLGGVGPARTHVGAGGGGGGALLQETVQGVLLLAEGLGLPGHGRGGAVQLLDGGAELVVVQRLDGVEAARVGRELGGPA